MKLKKKYECLKCKSVVEENGKCSCDTIIVVEGNLVKGTLGVDTKNISPVLLNENN